MTPENFCYWLKGWFELNDNHGFDKFEPSIKCVDAIKAHLDLVFVNVTKPSLGGNFEYENTGAKYPEYPTYVTSDVTKGSVFDEIKRNTIKDDIRYC